MKIEINKDLEVAIEAAANLQNVSVDDVVNDIVRFSLNTYVAAEQANKLLYLLENEVLPRIANVEVSNIATRHQLTNLHADVLENSDRALVIADEATQIGLSTIFKNEE
ncbi:hypothetical protein [Arcobacter sp. FWKO B]|uniref:hypothetical protein n=1 Tax=Arcobacter sp. FWKO B TaxID=2593672 RepID=UPI0018A33F02|nr:hypothetical protein [Arcobacter sp. FWKO B]QOG13039.1 hypothetical protein FWKOB_10215 [Arcobacter sp. FWKO B]